MLAKYQYMLSVPVSVMVEAISGENAGYISFSHDTETDNEDTEGSVHIQ